MKDVKLEESELQNPSQRKAIVGSDMLVQELEQKTLQFAFQNGKIDSICADDSETVWSLNVKRGILSMLQSTMDKDQSIEKDIQEVRYYFYFNIVDNRTKHTKFACLKINFASQSKQIIYINY